ncbi:hypothetical protein QNH46_21900 [Paenibacillus woosongensis]|uniref:Uncharacterized protein n=1 Tax=Paenibacillus woosongensis TaxID=307580 RepID=A0AA95I185_9BACL|nr:hypothetical protein [Paenibacillus woosongensis]WHX48674.1 hypothetical protein QNH46_21900 [Paenibacillus woosongensis]
MFEGFLEMQAVVTRVHEKLGLGGEAEYRKLEFGAERFLHAPEPGRHHPSQEQEQPGRFSIRKIWSQ